MVKYCIYLVNRHNTISIFDAGTAWLLLHSNENVKLKPNCRCILLKYFNRY